MIITVTLTWVKGQYHTESVHHVCSTKENFIIIICINLTRKTNFFIQCVAETSYGQNDLKIILKDPPEAMLWANFEVNLNFGTKGLLLSSNKHEKLVGESILYIMGYFDVTDGIITLR